MPSRLKETVLVAIGSSSCSGIITSVEHGYVLTHASLLLPYLESRPELYRRLVKSGKLDGGAFKDLSVQVTCERSIPSLKAADRSGGCDVNHFPSSRCYATSLINLTRSEASCRCQNSNGGMRKLSGHIEAVWKSQRFAETLRLLFPRTDSWKFWDDPVRSDSGKQPTGNSSNKQQMSMTTGSEEQTERIFQLLSCFVMIKTLQPLLVGMEASWDLIPGIRSDIKLTVGEPLFIIGTPFGSLSPPVFLNSMSRGIVCNLVGEGQELILTDARCIPGTEGGAIYDGNG